MTAVKWGKEKRATEKQKLKSKQEIQERNVKKKKIETIETKYRNNVVPATAANL